MTSHDARIPQEDDRIATAKIVAVSFWTAVLFAAGIFWAWRIARTETLRVQPAGRPSTPALMGAREIGMVNQWPFAAGAGADETLDEYGWVDKRRGVVRIPIERAMRQTVEEVER